MIANIDHDEMEYSRWDLIENITEDLLVLMEEQGVTKTELAEALLTGKSNITQALNGSRNMTLKTLSDICFALGVRPNIDLYNKQTSEKISFLTDETKDILKVKAANQDVKITIGQPQPATSATIIVIPSSSGNFQNSIGFH